MCFPHSPALGIIMPIMADKKSIKNMSITISTDLMKDAFTTPLLRNADTV